MSRAMRNTAALSVIAFCICERGTIVVYIARRAGASNVCKRPVDEAGKVDVPDLDLTRRDDEAEGEGCQRGAALGEEQKSAAIDAVGDRPREQAERECPDRAHRAAMPSRMGEPVIS